jgi:hypothetical protein
VERREIRAGYDDRSVTVPLPGNIAERINATA